MHYAVESGKAHLKLVADSNSPLVTFINDAESLILQTGLKHMILPQILEDSSMLQMIDMECWETLTKTSPRDRRQEVQREYITA